jgi:hypothetical protein
MNLGLAICLALRWIEAGLLRKKVSQAHDGAGWTASPRSCRIRHSVIPLQLSGSVLSLRC